MTTKLLARDIGLEPGFTFRIQKCPLTHDYYVHSHDFSELVVILSGSAVHIIEGREYPVTAGQVFLIHSGVSHGYKNVEDIEYVNVMFQPEELLQQPELRLLPGFQALFYIEPFYRQEMYFRGMLSLDAGQLLEATRLLDLILSEHERREDGYRLMVRTYFTALVGMLSRYYQNSSRGEDNKALRIGEAVTYIEEHFLQPVTLQSMADMAYMSTRQFLRVFTRNYKTTPMDYVIRKRLDYSCTLLRNPDLPVSRVAMDSGFHDQNYYARQFRKSFNCTPTEYRERISGSGERG
ncbi:MULTISPECIES: AraC family transcriptional regulator [unclassified Paenibacillus]|uniref:helix-turn-helix domain-containing protein n=1 Tax=unclassified Paenibacillus TaxID=185978 RepID=UPI002406AFB7|nr:MULTISPECIES: AraC family transcriptional regulator [unclassified Paenibacillus]MDF9844543.1 AraC-like DNA-binding protein [Paenibacillus sp. PastF-2]MDF9851172.1 AraC-like DNA-binding protein [Paenibacillus sp. PastM-2]MDF9856193.1 AraC-like DNA-binding protein [Paenibacillus sp. PastF-1]MDH6481578.1 AraC-like DNA-binding protein [Paenibacillus sp. PastH-2]MDH6510409.1 AraC-like DNA-binding protein [Paenibacillus sp. PastM-3]